MARPNTAHIRTRSRVVKIAITDIRPIAKPMQLRMSTLNRSVQGLCGYANAQSCKRKRNAREKRYPARRSAEIQRDIGGKPCFSRRSIKKASVMPVSTRKIAGPMPPMNWDSMNGPSDRSSGRLKEWKTWPCSMITTAMPRA